MTFVEAGVNYTIAPVTFLVPKATQGSLISYSYLEWRKWTNKNKYLEKEFSDLHKQNLIFTVCRLLIQNVDATTLRGFIWMQS